MNSAAMVSQIQQPWSAKFSSHGQPNYMNSAAMVSQIQQPWSAKFGEVIWAY